MDRSNTLLTSRVTVASRRKWLSLLLDTDNEKVAAAYQKYDQFHKANVEAANKGNAATMPKSGAIGPVKPITPEELSARMKTIGKPLFLGICYTRVSAKSFTCCSKHTDTIKKH